MEHAKVDCYRLIGYPPNFKFKKKFGNPNDPNVHGGYQRTQAHFVNNDTGRIYNDAGPSRAAYTDSNRDLPNNNQSGMMFDSHKGGGPFGTYFRDWCRGPGPSNYFHNQYSQMQHHMDNPQHYAQFHKLIDKDNMGESSANIRNFTEPFNMRGNAFVSHACNMSHPFIASSKEFWIIDIGASNHMISNKNMLTNEVIIPISVNNKQVHLPNCGSIVVSNVLVKFLMDKQ